MVTGTIIRLMLGITLLPAGRGRRVPVDERTTITWQLTGDLTAA